jgi:hypothetical protein
MTKQEATFEEWFDQLTMSLWSEYDINFADSDSVKEDYEAGKSVSEVQADIAREYSS